MSTSPIPPPQPDEVEIKPELPVTEPGRRPRSSMISVILGFIALLIVIFVVLQMAGPWQPGVEREIPTPPPPATTLIAVPAVA